MCGRFGRTTPVGVFARLIDAELSDRLDDTLHYNRPPGTFQACVLRHPKTGVPTLGSAWWGYTSSQAEDRQLSQINAHSETAGSKPLFAQSYIQRPCLIPVDWWFEWQRKDGRKTPHAIQAADSQPFFSQGSGRRQNNCPRMIRSRAG